MNDKTSQTLLRAICNAKNQEDWHEFYSIYEPTIRMFLGRLGLNDTDIEDELISEDVPASGEYYLTSRLDILASGLNALVEILIDNSTINTGDIPYYPFYVGEIVE
jgi:hypothetical protein